MKLKITEGTTSKLVKIFVQDSSSSTGAGLTGLAHNTAGLKWYWIAEGDASSTSVTLATATLGTYTSGGFIVVDATNMPGVYEIGIPDAAIDSSSEGSVAMMLSGATNMAPVLIEIELDSVDYRDADTFGVTNLANFYAAKIELVVDDSSGNDEYQVSWFKNGIKLTSGVSSPTIQVVDDSGSDLVASTAMSEITTTETFKYTESSNRIATGQVYRVQVQATIDSATRTWVRLVSRDN